MLWLARLLTGFIRQNLIKAVLFAAVGLILYGFFPGPALIAILLLFTALRLSSILLEAIREHGKSPSPGNVVHFGSELCSSPRDDLNPSGTRARSEMFAEALGVVALAVIVPLCIALYTRDFFSFRSSQGWPGAAVAVLCLVAYACPWRWKASELSILRSLWWVLPFVIGLPLLSRAIDTRHPYLNPLNPNHDRLAADRVLSLQDHVIAARHADWVLRYAQESDLRGDSQVAAHYYRQALRLDPARTDAYERLAHLERQLGAASAAPAGNRAFEAPENGATRAYWKTREKIPRSPRVRIADLTNVEACTAMLVPVGSVPEEMLDRLAFAVRNELGIPTVISANAVPLPEFTRVRGLATGPQWSHETFFSAFTNAVRAFPKVPVKFVLITPADMYAGQANYLFSISYPWGAVVSYARFGEYEVNNSQLFERTAKQTLCAVIKSFGIPPSTDRQCVTSFARSLEAFDAKGSRPNSQTMAVLQQTLAELNRAWHEQSPQRR